MNHDELASLTLEHLRAIRAKQDEQGDDLAAIRLELSAMGQQLAGLTSAVYSGKSELDSLKRGTDRTPPGVERATPLNFISVE